MLTRRSAFHAVVAGMLTGTTNASTASQGRLKQSVARWCYQKMTLDDLAKEGARIGLKGIDLISHQEWPIVQKYGLMPAMTPGAGTIADGLNRKENHERLEREFRENIEHAAAAGVPNVITFSGNRRGLPDDIGLDNTVAGLNRVKKLAEDKGVTICLELLNSKVDHKDYQCDHTAWGVEVIKHLSGIGIPACVRLTRQDQCQRQYSATAHSHSRLGNCGCLRLSLSITCLSESML